MSTTCPNGHESEWADWCSVCGERLGDGGAVPGAPGGLPGSAGASPPDPESVSGATPVSASSAAATGLTCDNCGVARHADNVFCESCGYDFASGSLPDTPEADADTDPVHAKVDVDHAFFEASVGDVDLELPDPAPDQSVVPLNGIRILIGRRSNSRGIYPEIDAQALNGDPAVSSRHAMLERSADGSWTLTDLGSTNGTFLTPEADDAIEAGTAHPIEPGTAFYIGAWTRITLASSTT